MQTHASTLHKSGRVRDEHEGKYTMYILELNFKIIFEIMHEYNYI